MMMMTITSLIKMNILAFSPLFLSLSPAAAGYIIPITATTNTSSISTSTPGLNISLASPNTTTTTTTVDKRGFFYPPPFIPIPISIPIKDGSSPSKTNSSSPSSSSSSSSSKATHLHKDQIDLDIEHQLLLQLELELKNRFRNRNHNRNHKRGCAINCHVAATRLSLVDNMADFQRALSLREPPELEWHVRGCLYLRSDTPAGFDFGRACERYNFGLYNYAPGGRTDSRTRRKIDAQMWEDLQESGCGRTHDAIQPLSATNELSIEPVAENADTTGAEGKQKKCLLVAWAYLSRLRADTSALANAEFAAEANKPDKPKPRPAVHKHKWPLWLVHQLGFETLYPETLMGDNVEPVPPDPGQYDYFGYFFSKPKGGSQIGEDGAAS